MKKTILAVLALILCVTALHGNANAAVSHTKHYVNGLGGVKVGSMPPEGWYLRQYHGLYSADKRTTNNGSKAGGDFDLDLYAFVNRLIYSSPIKFLGGNLLFDVIVPVSYADMSLTMGGRNVIDDNRWGLGDISITPFTVAWHGDWYDATIGASIYFPTGDFNKNHSVNPGKGFTTFMFTSGGTLYFDQEKTWHASLLSRYEAHTKQEGTGVTHGNDFQFEWGVGKTFAKKFDIGVAGYCHWQITEDSGSNSNNYYQKNYGIGPEVAYRFADWGLHTSLRTLWEFGGKNGTEGNMTVLTFTKSF